MMRLKRSSKNSAKRGLLVSFALAISIAGCSSSFQPNYLKKDIPKAITDIAKKELGLDITCRMVDQTLWVYWPTDNLFEPLAKPQKYTDKFSLEENKSEFKKGNFMLTYKIAPIEPKEKAQDFGYKKDVLEKMNRLWNVIRRVLFSVNRKKSSEPEYILLIIADIKNGFEIRGACTLMDLKKISYGFISVEEYQHRALQNSEFLPSIIGDQAGSYLNYHNFTREEFLCQQIQYRIKLKFQKPEVEKNADIDKEIEKIVANTLKIYRFDDFNAVEFNNLSNKNKFVLNQAAILDKPIK